jgi:hypothetical protein
VWEKRDLPVLRAIVELTDEGEWHMSAEQIAERADLDLATVRIALVQLANEHPPFFKFHDRPG